MNIWLLTGEYPPDFGGGIGTYSFHTAEMLSQRGHTLTVFTADENLMGGWQVNEASPRLRVVRFAANQSPQSSALGNFARWSYDAALVLTEFSRKEGKPDVLESQEYLGMPYFTLQRRLVLDEALTGVPVLVTAHTPLYLCRHYDLLPAYRFPAYWIGQMERFSLLAADGVVYPSHYLREEIENSHPRVQGHSRVIANPFQVQVEPSTLSQDTKRRGFLFTAKMERRKGIEPLLATFKQLWSAGLDEPLYLVGDDWYDELRQQWMSENINQRYGKYIEDKLLRWEGKQPGEVLKDKLREVRAMILPSLSENLPYAVLEAMAEGCPVIVSKSGGHAEIVEHGVSGYVFSHLELGDMEAKTQIVLDLTHEEHQRLVAAAQARVKQVCGYEVIAPQKEDALEWVRDKSKHRKHFPFLEGSQHEFIPPEDKELSGEPGLLSVVIPFYNLGKYLEDALKSFDSLSDVPFEVIVVDDMSTDQESLDSLHTLHEQYQFKLIHTQARGLATARNTGAHSARGEFLAFLDSDDCMDPVFYGKAIKVFNHYVNISFVGCWAQYFGGDQNYWPTWNPEPPYAMVHNPINTGALVYRKADFLRYGLNDPAIGFIMEDYDSMLSMLENGCRGVSIPEPYYKYRVRSDSMFHTTNESFKIWTYQQIAQKHRELYSTYAEEILGITNSNGPGYIFDNPTLSYPTLGFAEDTTSPNGQFRDADFTQASTGTLFYFAVRSILHRPYSKLLDRFPGLKNLIDTLRKSIGVGN